VKKLSQRWHGDGNVLKSWEEVRVPELVHFLGFDEKVLDLGGEWQVHAEEAQGTQTRRPRWQNGISRSWQMTPGRS